MGLGINTSYFKIKPPPGAQINWGSSISQGLTAVWLFNEGGGLLSANLIGLNQAVINSGVTWTNIPGLNDVSVFFDGNSSRVIQGQNQTGVTTDLILEEDKPTTIIVGMYPTIDNQSGSACRLLIRNSTGDVEFNILPTAAMVWNIFGGSTPLAIQTSNSFLTLNSFNHVTMTYDGVYTGTNTHFYNGITEATYVTQTAGVGTPADTSGDALLIGNRPALNRAFGGYISYIYIWNRVLTKEEIISVYSNPYTFIIGPNSTNTFFNLAPPSGVANINTSVLNLSSSTNLVQAKAVWPQLYNRFKANILAGLFHVGGSGAHIIKIVLVNSSYVFNSSHNTYGNISAFEVSGAGYTSGGQVLGNLSVNQDDIDKFGIFFANNPSWNNSSITARYAILYDATLITKDLVACIDFQANYSSSGGTFQLTFNTNGLIILQ